MPTIESGLSASGILKYAAVAAAAAVLILILRKRKKAGKGASPEKKNED